MESKRVSAYNTARNENRSCWREFFILVLAMVFRFDFGFSVLEINFPFENSRRRIVNAILLIIVVPW